MILISACLLGENCKYNGGNNLSSEMLAFKNEAIAICPEAMGGLTIPRVPCEIEPGFDGMDVIEGRARVYDKDGRDVTQSLIGGAKAVLDMAVRNHIQTVYLKQSSPSCGCGIIYDGTFQNKKKAGDGVCAAMLKRAGIEVIPVI